MPRGGMIQLTSAPIHSGRQEDVWVVTTILRELEREAVHLSRRDGKRRRIVQWEDDPPVIEETGHGPASGSLIFANVGRV